MEKDFMKHRAALIGCEEKEERKREERKIPVSDLGHRETDQKASR